MHFCSWERPGETRKLRLRMLRDVPGLAQLSDSTSDPCKASNCTANEYKARCQLDSLQLPRRYWTVLRASRFNPDTAEKRAFFSELHVATMGWAMQEQTSFDGGGTVQPWKTGPWPTWTLLARCMGSIPIISVLRNQHCRTWHYRIPEVTFMT